MTRDQKNQLVAELKEKFENNPFFYITDTSELTVEQTNKLRGICFEKGVDLKVYKNTLVKKALEQLDDSSSYEALFETLSGPTALMFSSAFNAPAKLIKEFRESHEKPVLKAAYIDTDVYLGDEQVEALSRLKSKEELIAEIVALLQSPVKNVMSSLSSGGQILSGLVKALEERGDQ